MKKAILVTLLITFGAVTQLFSQATLVDKNKPNARIVLITDDSNSLSAANILQTFVERISGAKLPIITSSKDIKKNDVVIDNSNKEYTSGKECQITEDGFYLSSKDNVVRIMSGKGNGVIYGVVTLLENYMGVDYFGDNEYNFTKQETINIPLIDKVDIPAFRYRQTQSYATRTDSLYKLWYRIDEPSEEFANTYWVHTFDKLLQIGRASCRERV